jgi:dTDP-4-dehydrorhamnose 3,5-epimerase
MLITVPPGLWHGMQALGGCDGAFVNFFDRLYDHAAPDEWRLPVANDVIPYRF